MHKGMHDSWKILLWCYDFLCTYSTLGINFPFRSVAIPVRPATHFLSFLERRIAPNLQIGESRWLSPEDLSVQLRYEPIREVTWWEEHQVRHTWHYGSAADLEQSSSTLLHFIRSVPMCLVYLKPLYALRIEYLNPSNLAFSTCEKRRCVLSIQLTGRLRHHTSHWIDLSWRD